MDIRGVGGSGTPQQASGQPSDKLGKMKWKVAGASKYVDTLQGVGGQLLGRTTLGPVGQDLSDFASQRFRGRKQ